MVNLNLNSFLFLEFLKWYKPLGNNFDIIQMLQFSALDDDESRFRFIYNLKGSTELVVLDKFANNKHNEIALALKNHGNIQFQAKRWNLALEIYSQSYHATPTENVKDISIILANRSAALFHLEMYDLAINDIDLAMPNYPKEIMYKIKERKAKCLLAKKELRPALQHFQETISCLDTNGLPDETRAKLEKEAKFQIHMLLKKLKKPNKITNLSNNQNYNKNVLHKSVKFDYNDIEGHFAIAKEDITVGEQILVQQPHCVWLSGNYCKTNCQHCFKRTKAPLPCPSCSNVVFCSKDCRDVALATYHRYECKILPLLWMLPSSSKPNLAIRIITQKNLDYFLNLKDELKSGITFDDALKLPSNDYRKVFNLVRHEKELGVNEFLEVCSISKFLADCLKLSGYFETDDEDDFMYIGELLCRNLYFLQINTHEIYEMQGLTKISIGAGLYPTLALFNHSCNPSIFRYFKGTTIVVNSIKTTKAGDMIGDTYGPIYTDQRIEDRYELLHNIFRFKCNCLACKENWPLYKELTENVLQFKCTGKKTCNNILQILVDDNVRLTNKCNRCGKLTNILKELEAIQGTHSLVYSGATYFANGECKNAMQKCIKALRILDKFTVPPFNYYAGLQQSMKACLMQLGNKQ